MFGFVRSGLARVQRHAKGVAVGVALASAAVITPVAAATPPSMTAVAFPIDLPSIVSAVVAAGAALLLAYFGVKIGFSFVKKLLSRLHRAV